MGEDVKITGKTNWGSEPYMISIGNRVLISFDVSFITHDGATFVIHKDEAYKDIYKFGRIQVGDNCFIGAKSIFLPSVKIGNNCIIAAGSVVTKNIPDGEVWGGGPAKFIMSTTKYAEKCKRNRPPYNIELLNKNKKAEMLRSTMYEET